MGTLLEKITYLLPLLGIELLFLRRSARSVVAVSITVSDRKQNTREYLMVLIIKLYL